MSLSYPREKRLALIQLETDSTRLFITSIPSKVLQTILKRLPAVNGFRPGKDTQMKLSSYLGRIHHWSEKDWSIFLQIWFEWTKTRTKIFSALNCLAMEEFERVIVGMSMDENETRDYISKLANADYRFSISQKQIEEWIRFGPFSPDQTIFSFIQKAPSEEQLKLYGKVESLSEMVSSQTVKINDATEHLATISSLNDDIRKEVRQMMTGSEQTELFIANIADRVSKLEVDMSETNVIQRGENQSTIALEERLFLLKQEMFEIKTTLQGINEELSRQQKDKRELIERYTVNEQVLAISNIETGVAYQRDSHELTLTQIAFKGTDTLDIGDNEQWLISRLKGNLNKLGVQLSDAKNIAATVISSLASGQLVTFSGSFSLSMAQCCATTFAGDALYLVRIPIGMLDPEEIVHVLVSILQLASNREFPVSVIFEGLNRSAFDVCGNILRQIVTERLLRVYTEYNTSILLFATLADGQSSLLERGFFEMGPVLYTDMVGWKNTASVAYEPAVIPKHLWTILTTPSTDNLEEMDENIFPSWFSYKNGMLWRKTVFTSLIFLQKIRLEHAYELLYFGWIFPLLTNFFPSRVTDFMNEIELDGDLHVMLESMSELVSDNENV